MLKYLVRIAMRKKGQRREYIIRAKNLEDARRIAKQRFGIIRGIRILKAFWCVAGICMNWWMN